MSGGPILVQLLLTTVLVFLFVGSLLGLALGLGLLLRARSMLPFIQLMNQWVSTRQALRPLELPLQVAPAAGGARWFGVVLIALGGFATAILVGRLDLTALAGLFKVDARTSLLSILLDAVRWFLVAGSLTAIVTGVMLVFFPQAWRRVEARANHWYSTRQLEIAGDMLHPSLDRIVEVFPRASGVAILALSLIAAAASGMLLLGGRG
jgi:uncharacterized protein YjeT (DUF2065 family)